MEQGKGTTKACVLCGEAIPVSAVKCSHCDGYQDWRRHLVSASTTVLSLIIALLSVLTVAAPILRTAVTPRDASIQITATSYSVPMTTFREFIKRVGGWGTESPFLDAPMSALTVEFLATNTGSKPGTITRLTLEGLDFVSFTGEKVGTLELRLTRPDGSPGSIVVQPGDTTLFAGHRGGLKAFTPKNPIRMKATIITGGGRRIDQTFDQAPVDNLAIP